MSTPRLHPLAAASLLALAATFLDCALRAQPAAPPPPPVGTAPAAPSASGTNAVVQLDPFEVKTNKDTSYGALNSNSITRFNLELNKTPVVADIFTSQFIQDTGATTLEDLFNDYGVGAGQVLATPSSDSTATQPGDRFSVSQFGVRGLSAGTPRFDGFIYSSTQTNATNLFDTDRVEVVHGSQGLLYGATGAGGVINIVSKQARFDQTDGTVEYRIDQYGSKLGNLDLNEGAGWFAVRLDVLQQNNQDKELFVGDQTQGYYGQIAVQLPLKTILRVTDEETHNNRVYSNNTTVNFGGASNDSRSGDNLMYLLATNQLGAIDPYTDKPYGVYNSSGQLVYATGAIDNGNVTPWNAKSWSGWSDEEDQDNGRLEAMLDTVWTSWLSTSVGALWGNTQELRATNLGNLTSPPVNGSAVNGNPLDAWAISTNWANSESAGKDREYRLAAVLTNDLFGGHAHSQTAIGFDRQYLFSTGGLAYEYYLANPDGSVSINPALNNLGRSQIPTAWWAVGNGPVEYPLPKVGAKEVMWNGQLYTRMSTDPRSSAWILPNNPLGLASLYEVGTVGSTNGVASGANSGGFADETRNQDFYLTNVTGWFNDKLDSMLGASISNVFTRNPNTSSSLANAPWTEQMSPNYLSYNFGLDYELFPAWRLYADYSRNYNNPAGSNDAYGDIPLNPRGYTYEAGLKFTPMDSLISGSLSFYSGYEENDNYNAGTNYENIVNPNGLNGRWQGGPQSPNQWAQYDKTSQGIELIMTAENRSQTWRGRFGVSLANGTVENTSQFAMVYNDQFYTDSKGDVLYANGQPFLVPTDTATLAKVAKVSSPVDPTTYGVALTPLTIAMINNPASPYYAYGWTTGQTTFNPANEPLNGSIGNPIGGSLGTQYLKDALEWFRNGGTSALTGATGLPLSDMQYAFADPGGLNGEYIVQKKGNRVVGAPAVEITITNTYTFPSGWLKAVELGGAVNLSYYNASYYYQTPNQAWHLFSAPTETPQVNVWLGYSRKIGRVVWHTQLNINNLFNRYSLVVDPSSTTGYLTASSLTANFYGVPRLYEWENSFSF